jgi:DNA repair exonuclease SbcCD ATPase subunit
MKAACVVCGKEFEKERNAKTCGEECGEEIRKKTARERARRYYAANREDAAERHRRYREANREKVQERQRRWREARRESSERVVSGGEGVRPEPTPPGSARITIGGHGRPQ